jgi:hypothetical protein
LRTAQGGYIFCKAKKVVVRFDEKDKDLVQKNIKEKEVKVEKILKLIIWRIKKNL